ncbi:small nuclear ribonucleoprotein G [Fonticula alba]|uniref:Sm protein G n=1 Tax=Fonticula alba TaxID=691883 RepID=A0A058Z506_FONAL|nr:small nuclear ribonucleoprotein G [Fonticula alba]KCV68597.1 small nuclear ribonucleoprotein G [Fonticula alba]|eukprot:XP_009497029.1 small nuclear ribonucleoprotein G [Fonticula alba]
MSVGNKPELRRFMDKRVILKMNAGRSIRGVVRGYDEFMNIVLDGAVDDSPVNVSGGRAGEFLGQVVIRGNSIIAIEALDFIPVTE